ncbi:hypothetical protein [Lacinutrix sp. Hel_I_90]|uniref:hypothetical protein n=1 Tax=Lacinutrix sp. Hel_I_90 TaxID=1249999 RepID=UPI0005CB0E7C|nr:hypothetical protein [Lacinutrix sp. Hel_I_90]
MKAQKNNPLDFEKNSISELNNIQLLGINGGTVSIINSSQPCIDAIIQESSARCQDGIFKNGF